MNTEEFRLYSFVAGLYLSPLQRGLQTAHVVSELFTDPELLGHQRDALMTWASRDKTIIICDAGNHKGVLECWTELQRTGIEPGFVTGAIFFEDEQSMNGMATACGVIVPKRYWDVTWVEDPVYGGHWLHSYQVSGGISSNRYSSAYAEGQFISHLKKYRLASS